MSKQKAIHNDALKINRDKISLLIDSSDRYIDKLLLSQL